MRRSFRGTRFRFRPCGRANFAAYVCRMLSHRAHWYAWYLSCYQRMIAGDQQDLQIDMGGPGSGRKRDAPGTSPSGEAEDEGAQRRYKAANTRALAAVNAASNSALRNIPAAQQALVCDRIKEEKRVRGAYPPDDEIADKLVGCMLEKLLDLRPGSQKTPTFFIALTAVPGLAPHHRQGNTSG